MGKQCSLFLWIKYTCITIKKYKTFHFGVVEALFALHVYCPVINDINYCANDSCHKCPLVDWLTVNTQWLVNCYLPYSLSSVSDFSPSEMRCCQVGIKASEYLEYSIRSTAAFRKPQLILNYWLCAFWISNNYKLI